jgi:L-seryl-tRNA(Ser) seleniumtransferase
MKKERIVAKLSDLPKVDKVLAWPELIPLLAGYPRPVVVEAVRKTLSALRAAIQKGEAGAEQLETSAIVDRVRQELIARQGVSLRRVVNGTGVVIHTNLGRAPLAQKVRETLDAVAFGYSNLEFELEEGTRGSRYSHVEQLLCELTGAEAALVVNNNAAALLMTLAALAAGKEVVVSRGELVEIGGSFRIPDIMRQSGTLLREVGTTNRTHPRDYRDAISADTAILLKVHTSNFAQVGFTAEVTAAELVSIGREYSVPVMADAGSGSLLDLQHAGLSEPTVQEYLRAGVDIVTFSGDKMLGGPQAGIIVGRKSILATLKQHPLLRALRMDKLGIAALEGTLRLYRDERVALARIPVLRMLTVSSSELSSYGRRLVRRLRRSVPATVHLSLAPGFSQVGGGALPLAELPSTLLVVRCDGLSPQEIERRLRTGDVPVVGRISKGEYLLDLRTILDDDVALLDAALRKLTE